MINAFDMCGGSGQSQYQVLNDQMQHSFRCSVFRETQSPTTRFRFAQNRHIDTEIAWFGAEASELIPALFSQENLKNGAAITTTVHHPLAVPKQPVWKRNAFSRCHFVA